MSHGWVLRELWKACAVPWNVPVTVIGSPAFNSAVWMAVTASPRAMLGFRLKESVVAGIDP